MAGTCAGCERPISRGTDFVLAGTEAYHRSCASLVTNGVRARLERDYRTVVAEANRLLRRANRLDEIEHRMSLAEAEVRDARGAVESARVGQARLAAANERLRARAEAAEAAQEREVNARIAAQAEVETLRAQLAAARARPADAVARVVTGGSAAPATEPEKDDTVLRFELLELT